MKDHFPYRVCQCPYKYIRLMTGGSFQWWRKEPPFAFWKLKRGYPDVIESSSSSVLCTTWCHPLYYVLRTGRHRYLKAVEKYATVSEFGNDIRFHPTQPDDVWCGMTRQTASLVYLVIIEVSIEYNSINSFTAASCFIHFLSLQNSTNVGVSPQYQHYR